MIITVSGSPKKVPLSDVKEMCQFFAKDLMHPRVSNSISLKIIFVPGLLSETGNYAFVDTVEWSGAILPRDFEMEIDDSLGKYINGTTLAHEFYHIKQYATGELKDNYTRLNKIRWKKRLFDRDKILAAGDDERHFNLPFEKEAHKFEKQLYMKWRNRNK